MKIENTHPPKHIWEKAHELFELDDRRVVYTYGNTLHNPGGGAVDRCLEAHESVHAIQQAAMGGPDKWWARYFADPAFRYDQELHAYREQYGTYCDGQHDRNARTKYLWELAKHLSSKMYGAGVGHAQAMKEIKG